jgi:CRP-like cAMP-binding protein
MTIEDDIAFLERIPTFALLGRPALRVVAMGAEGRNLRAGEVLFRAGEKADSGFVVQQGSLVLRPYGAEDGTGEVVVGPGALIGELSLLIETARPGTATTIEPTAVMRISRSLFLKMLDNFPDAAVRLRDYIGARTEEALQEMSAVRGDHGPPEARR